MNDVFFKQEAGRKRLAKLLGIAPYRIDLTIVPDGVSIEIDGKPATDEQVAVFSQDVEVMLSKFKKYQN